MEKYDKKQVDEKFEEGMKLLASQRYRQAIEIFSQLIEGSEPHLSDKEALITYETSLNNRGVAKCNLGLEKQDKTSFEEGLKDYQRSIDASGGELESPNLTAQRNLENGRIQLKDWGKSQQNNFKLM